MFINFGCSASQAAQFAGKKGGKKGKKKPEKGQEQGKQQPKNPEFPITSYAQGEEGGLSPIQLPTPVPKKPGGGKRTECFPK
ncbi:MAG: hypothetical protein K2X01_04240 [Cyanobacteria bacterium]|nr:hypothetical protein [Cyanobacteriota bacterium]